MKYFDAKNVSLLQEIGNHCTRLNGTHLNEKNEKLEQKKGIHFQILVF